MAYLAQPPAHSTSTPYQHDRRAGDELTSTGRAVRAETLRDERQHASDQRATERARASYRATLAILAAAGR